MNKPSILLISNTPNWAYHEIIKFIIKKLSYKYDFFVDFTWFNINRDLFIKDMPIYNKVIYEIKQILKIPYKLKYRSIQKNNTEYDIIFYTGFFMDLTGKFNQRYRKLIKGIYTDGFPPQGIPPQFNQNLSIDEFVKFNFSNTDALVCGAPKICDFYKKYFTPTFFANMAWDEKTFCIPINKNFRKNKFVIGWTGNPNRGFKGYYDLIVPVIDHVKEKRPNIEFKTRFSGPVETLPQFYSDVDLILIASSADAGPSLFMEASLCGVPSISTKVGIPEFVIKDGENGYFSDRKICSFVDKIIFLYDNRELLEDFSLKIRNDYISLLGEKIQTKNWENIFDFCLGDKS